MPRLRHILLLPLLAGLALRADWKQDVGHDRLVATFTSGVPDAVTAGVTQVEAGTNTIPSNNYLPTSTNSQFTGKTINNLGDGTGTSNHATTIGGSFYGNTNSLIPGTTQIDAYSVSSWINATPYADTRLVQNHSWVARASGFPSGTDLDQQALAINLRVDVMANQGSIIVAGADNDATTAIPVWLSQGYNLISVGRSDGQHSAGYTVYDGAGRIKPDIVAPAPTTSEATARLSSAAAVLAQKLSESPLSLAGAHLPRVTKALLLAGATKEKIPTWTRTNAHPLDLRYGAGEANLLLAYRILSGGPATASGTQTVPDTAWASASVRNVTTSSSRSYFFDVPAETTDARFSAALVWHRPAAAGANGSISYSAPANLTLALHAVDAGTFDLGEPVDTSQSTVDNVEHIYQAALAPGRYALVVSSTSGSSTAYALAWRTSPTVTVAATDATAAELDGSTATFTLTRTGSTTSPLLVPLTWSGTAVSVSHYNTPPDSVLIAAGQSSATVTITPFPDNLAQGDRTVIASVATDYSLTAGTAGSATVTIEDKPFDSWRFSRFTSEQLADETVSGDTADPEGDGRDNLLEYALATEPLADDATTHAPVTSVDNDRLAITYLEAAGRDDLSYSVETTTDLTGEWSTGATELEETARVATADGEEVTVRRVNTAARQFLRLRVSR